MGLLVAAARPAGAIDTESPNTAIPKPECDPTTPVLIRYASSSARLYLESADGITRGGCVTLRDIWESRGGKAPLYAVDPSSGDVSSAATGTWLLTESLYVEDGITLQVSRFFFSFFFSGFDTIRGGESTVSAGSSSQCKCKQACLCALLQRMLRIKAKKRSVPWYIISWPPSLSGCRSSHIYSSGYY